MTKYGFKETQHVREQFLLCTSGKIILEQRPFFLALKGLNFMRRNKSQKEFCK